MRIVLSLDSWPALRDFAGDGRSELMAAVGLAELAGVDAVRLSINEELQPVRETDVDALRRAARQIELRMPVSQGLLKVPLESRPDERDQTVSQRADHFDQERLAGARHKKGGEAVDVGRMRALHRALPDDLAGHRPPEP